MHGCRQNYQEDGNGAHGAGYPLESGKALIRLKGQYGNDGCRLIFVD
jgi:hypothetical protein